MSFVVSSVHSGFINYWHLRWEKVGNVVWEETQESATGLNSLRRRMWCEPNMKTNELSHVQPCFTLPALIPICPPGQQAWIKHLEGRELGGKKRSAITFSITARWHVETALWNLWWYKADQEITADILPYLVLKRLYWNFWGMALHLMQLIHLVSFFFFFF